MCTRIVGISSLVHPSTKSEREISKDPAGYWCSKCVAKTSLYKIEYITVFLINRFFNALDSASRTLSCKYS